MHITLSDGEWKLMRALWRKAPQSITELTAVLKAETAWSKHTIITMLARLEHKGAVTHHTGERAKQYRPLLDRAEATHSETENFLGKVYGGSLGLLLNTMVQSSALAPEDLAQLSAMLKQAEAEQGALR